MPRVYDEEKTDNLNALTGIDERAAKAMEKRAGKDADASIRAKEYAAANKRSAEAGKRIMDAPGGTRGNLKEQESSNLYNPGADKNSGRKTNFRTKIALAGFLSGMVGLGGGAALFGSLAGPAQFIHAAKLLQDVHLDKPGDQTETRLMGMVRYARAFQRGVPQDSRLSVLGKRIAPRAEARFNTQGFTSGYGPLGAFRGYVVDPTKPRGGVFDKMTDADRTPQGFADFVQRELGIVGEVDGDSVRISSTQEGFTYRVNQQLMRHIQLASGANRITAAINIRAAGQRAGMGRMWHPIERLDRKILVTAEDIYNAWLKRNSESVERGAGAVRPTTEARPGEDGEQNPDGERVASDADEIVNDANEARGSPEAMEEFRNKLKAKLNPSFTALGIVDLICILYYANERADAIRRANIEDPAQRLAGGVAALGSQIADGGADLDGESDQVGFWAEKMTDEKTRTAFFDSQNWHKHAGKPGGTPLPSEISLGASQDPVAQFFNDPLVASSIGTICTVASGLTAAIVFIGVAVLTGGLGAAFVGLVVGAIVGALVIEFLANYLAGTQIDFESIAGATFGGVVDLGGFSLAQNQAIGNGSLPVPAATAMELTDITADEQVRQFRQKSLAYRLLNANEPRSAIAQVVQSQQPDPAANVAQFAAGFLNIGPNLASLLSQPLRMATVGAASIPVDYGVPEFAFSPEEMADERFEMPYLNANQAVALLDSQEGQNVPDDENYVKRVKVCFGVTLAKQAMKQNLEGEPTEPLWGVSPPKQGDLPFYKTILTGKLPAEMGDVDPITQLPRDYRCTTDESVEWKRIRFFVIDNNALNSYVCYDGDPTDPDTDQACIDSGMKPDPSATSSGGTGVAANCGATGGSGGSITGAGPLNHIIPANPTIDPISSSVVGAFPEPTSYGNVYEFGQTVVCSGPSDPVYNVTSGNADWGPNAFDVPVTTKKGTGTCNPLHIPAGTQPPSGSDGWVVVIDSTKPDLYCVMWIGAFDGTNWSMAYGGVYDLDGGGVPVLAGSGSGSDIPQSPILTSEIEAGVINHALGFASPKNASGVRAPATKSDGGGSGPFIEGMRFQLDPTFDCNAMPTKAEKAVCVALQVYGAYDVDNTGGGTGWFFQANDPNGVYPAAGITGDYMRFENIPLDRMRLLANWEGN